MAVPKKNNNLALCYHGIVLSPEEKSPYRSYINDFKEQIEYLIKLGYNFVKPTKYYEWYIGKYIPSSPIATIMFDDALDSVNLVTPWLIEMQIPFAISVIVSKLKKYTPEQDYISWSSLKTLTDSNLCEILSHSFNMHHTNLQFENTQVLSAPIMEAPYYLDNGEFLYIAKDDKRYYWDLSHIDNISWSFPLIGTDTITKKPITSTVKFTASKNIKINIMRFWTCLHKPYGTGYNAKVKIYINNKLVSDYTLNTTQYGNKKQWPERAFITIPLNTTFQIESGKVYTVKFVTGNVGNSTFMIYSIPSFTNDSELTSTCSGETFALAEIWPAKACMIFTDGKGNAATDLIYSNYVYNDILQSKVAVSKYLNATWSSYTTGYLETDPLETVVIGGTYSNGLLANTKIKFHADNNFVGEIIKIKYTSSLGKSYPLVIDIYINDTKVGEFQSSWWDWHRQEIQITPFSFQAGMDYIIRFKTKNASPGLGLVRIYLDQMNPPKLLWDYSQDTWGYPGKEAFVHEMGFEVANTEGTDMFPDDVTISGTNYNWVYKIPYDGPGKPFLQIMSCVNGNFMPPTQIVYPFGSYYSSTISNGSTTMEDVHPSLMTELINLGISSGFTVWDEPLSNYNDIQNKYTKYVIPRYLVPGDVDQTVILSNFNTLIGI
jgi:hypothetical protein